MLFRPPAKQGSRPLEVASEAARLKEAPAALKAGNFPNRRSSAPTAAWPR